MMSGPSAHDASTPPGRRGMSTENDVGRKGAADLRCVIVGEQAAELPKARHQKTNMTMTAHFRAWRRPTVTV